jgi:hypothetical protein
LIVIYEIIFVRAYRSISYTLDGNYLLAGGRSKYISLYNIHEQILVKRFEVTCNKSFDGLNVRFVVTLIYMIFLFFNKRNILIEEK